MNLKEWALVQGVHPVTAYRWYREGKLPVPARRAGRLILVDPDPRPVEAGRVVAYCRVFSADQKDDLERQVGRVVIGATGQGLAVGQVVSEIGSGMNGHRRELTRLLSDPAVSVIVVEHRDRLTRFGFEHLAASLAASGRRIVVLNDAETSDDLVRDVTEVLTSLCARLYGKRSASRRAARAVAVATSGQLG
ncbi:MAG: IS607 family transposase [Micromonosporaceae bacterium]